MLKSDIDVFFCDVISLIAPVFIVSSNRVSMKRKLKLFYVSVFVI